MSKEVKKIVRLAIIAGLYVALTWATLPLSYGLIQFRVSEILLLLCFYRKDYIYSLVLGCFIANFLSPMYLIDVPVGTFATFLSVLLMAKSRNIYLAILYPVLLNGLIIGLELHFVLGYPPLSSIFYVALGEFTVLIFGLLIFKTLIRKQGFRDLIEAEQNIG